MRLSKNPTGTAKIERAWRGEIDKRIKRLQKQIDIAFGAMVFDPLMLNRQLTNDEYDPSQIDKDRFMDQLSIFIAEYIGQKPPEAWMNKYQEVSYIRGNESAMNMMYTPSQRQQLALFDTLAVPMGKLDQETLTALYNRAYRATVQWATDLENRIGIIIEVPSIAAQDVADIKKAIDARVSVMQSRNNVIAQTETIQANQEASIVAVARENERLNQKIGTMFTDPEIKKLQGGDIDGLFDDEDQLDIPFESRRTARGLRPIDLKQFEVAQFEAGGFKLRWVSRADEKVRELHRQFHGKLMTPERAQRNITISPWNCRCALIAVPRRDQTAKKQKSWNAQRELLLSEPELN